VNGSGQGIRKEGPKIRQSRSETPSVVGQSYTRRSAWKGRGLETQQQRGGEREGGQNPAVRVLERGRREI